MRLKARTIAALLVASFATGAGIALVRRYASSNARQASAVPTSSVAEARVPAPYTVALPILDGKLTIGWEDWGWGKHEFSTVPPHVIFGNYGGVVFRHADITDYFGALVFRFRAPASFGDFLEVGLAYQALGTDMLPRVRVNGSMIANLENGWKEVLIPWRALNPSNSAFDRLEIRAFRLVGQDPVDLDHVVLTKPDLSGIAEAPVRSVKLVVDCSKPGIAISPFVYGIARAAGAGETAHRIGGNAMSRLNWDLGAWNTGSDWYFENQPGEGPTGPWKWFDENVGTGTKLAMVVPTIGWVAKDGSSVGFPTSKFGKQRGTDPGRPEAGNGLDAAGKELAAGPPTQTSVPAPPELIQRWIQKVRERDATRGARSVDVFILDNEPDLWNSTHRDVHPDPVGYDELLDRTVRYASVIRDADPDAIIAGPASWGWPAYHVSAKDLKAGWLIKPDRRAHGDQPLLAYYLDQLSSYEKKNGKRLLDWLDVHYYPQAQGVYGKDAKVDPATSALRLRSTRSLWDPTYRDESWINDNVRLIPRLRDWVAQNYPGRGIMLGEWGFGADQHMSGGLAIAEALGRFGQQGLTAAFYWDALTAKSPGYWAFRAFRNFDGAGAHFLDWSLPTQETSDVSLFASRDESGSRLVLVLVNRDPTFAAGARIELSKCGTPNAQRSFVYDGGPTGLRDVTAPAAARGAVRLTAPPYSISVIDLGVENTHE